MDTEPRPSAARFATTHWSVVLTAAHGTSERRRAALETLCRMYWQPVYAYIRRRGYDSHRAEDLTQEFFARVLEKDGLKRVDASAGRFRSYLLGAVKHVLANARDREEAKKRGGGRANVPLDIRAAESGCRLEPAHVWTPERVFDRCWALSLLEHVLSRLENEFERSGKGRMFQGLKAFLVGGNPATSYREAGAALNLTTGAVKVAVHRMRRRYRRLLEEEVAHTVSSREDVDDELRFLLAALRG